MELYTRPFLAVCRYYIGQQNVYFLREWINFVSVYDGYIFKYFEIEHWG